MTIFDRRTASVQYIQFVRGERDLLPAVFYHSRIVDDITIKREHAEAVNCTVKPVVFESTGRLHPETTKLFKRIAGIEDGSKSLDDTNLYRYWMRVISVTLQRGLARAFLVGRKRLMSNNYKIPAKFSLCNVTEFNDFYTMNNSSNDE